LVKITQEGRFILFKFIYYSFFDESGTPTPEKHGIPRFRGEISWLIKSNIFNSILYLPMLSQNSKHPILYRNLYSTSLDLYVPAEVEEETPIRNMIIE
jgi:hypothetical protein